MAVIRPSDQMRDLGVVQYGTPTLAETARRFDLPSEEDIAAQTVETLHASMERVARVHPFAKGMGIAAPQIGVGRAVALVRPANSTAEAIVLFNPRITARSEETDEQYEGSLSFFDVRGLVPRPLMITVVAAEPDGTEVTTVYERGLARLVAHESTTSTAGSTQPAYVPVSSRSRWRSTGTPAGPGPMTSSATARSLNPSHLQKRATGRPIAVAAGCCDSALSELAPLDGAQLCDARRHREALDDVLARRVVVEVQVERPGGGGLRLRGHLCDIPWVALSLPQSSTSWPGSSSSLPQQFAG
ncbi:peptide deformylase [Streptomyces sp. KLMMK]|uniref:peptide deformylase n=1 Tax=Streptomyces sp. KLMMK TaxID=3109353 RepID=UPI00300855C3